jgi:hypothetical protein
MTRVCSAKVVSRTVWSRGTASASSASRARYESLPCDAGMDPWTITLLIVGGYATLAKAGAVVPHTPLQKTTSTRPGPGVKLSCLLAARRSSVGRVIAAVRLRSSFTLTCPNGQCLHCIHNASWTLPLSRRLANTGCSSFRNYQPACIAAAHSTPPVRVFSKHFVPRHRIFVHVLPPRARRRCE